jgi:myo-inositol 2-dehydrogenase / D-chiro-inositol 1-dehydrogenase
MASRTSSPSRTLLINSIRGDGPHINNVMDVAESTMTGIMGREAAYSGELITWDQAMQSTLDLYPKDLTPGANLPVRPVRVPGAYRFS